MSRGIVCLPDGFVPIQQLPPPRSATGGVAGWTAPPSDRDDGDAVLASSTPHDELAGVRYSHSIVAGGFDEMSYATRLMPRTSLMMRFDARPRTS